MCLKKQQKVSPEKVKGKREGVRSELVHNQMAGAGEQKNSDCSLPPASETAGL